MCCFCKMSFGKWVILLLHAVRVFTSAIDLSDNDVKCRFEILCGICMVVLCLSHILAGLPKCNFLLTIFINYRQFYLMLCQRYMYRFLNDRGKINVWAKALRLGVSGEKSLLTS